jgi:hypothetical protein
VITLELSLLATWHLPGVLQFTIASRGEATGRRDNPEAGICRPTTVGEAESGFFRHCTV